MRPRLPRASAGRLQSVPFLGTAAGRYGHLVSPLTRGLLGIRDMDLRPTYWIVLTSDEQLGKLMASQRLIITLNTRPSTVSLLVVTLKIFLWRTVVGRM